MNIMRNLAVLSVFILVSFSVFAQDQPSEVAKGNAILSQNNVNTKCRNYLDTPEGIYIGTRTGAGEWEIYCYENGTLTVVKSLDSYNLRGYSKTTNSLIVTSKSNGERFTKVSLYNLKTNSFKLLADYGKKGYSGIYGLELNGDTLVCLVNTKRTGKGEVGSEVLPQTIILK
jgi:hypothetical protein